ncbi:hypothetical protein HKW98_11630 [Stutzerimonas urumqiensis]|uniref:hypothetical protein n=1 Tax=Stutzerimonas urumqiensis TaxID=638269 RepID=UPI003BAB8A60
MSLPLSNATELSMRKDLVRLRMEMHRQQLLYNAQPLSNPVHQFKGMLAHRAAASASNKRPLMLATTVVLALFGKRLGKVGRLARIALAVYPLIKGKQRLQRH